MTDRKRVFFGGVASVMSGTAVGVAAVGLSSPLLTRLYSPEQFGVLGIVMAVSSLAIAAGAGKLDAAIPLEPERSDAADVGVAGAVFGVVAGFVTLLVLLVLRHTGATAGNNDALDAVLMLLPVFVVVVALSQIGYGLALRSGAFRRVAFGRALGPTVAAATQLALGIMAPTAEALVYGQLAGLVFVLLLFTGYARGELRGWSLTGVSSAFRRHWRMPVFIATGNLITMASLHAPLVVLGSQFSLRIAGLYAITYRVLTAPALLFGQAVGQVFYAQVAQEPTDEGRRAAVARTAGGLSDISLVLFPWLFLVAPDLFRLVFGEQWTEAGQYARLLIPWLGAGFVASPLSHFAVIVGRQSAVFKLTLIETAARVISLAAGLVLDSPRVLVGAFGATGAIIAVSYSLWILVLARVNVVHWLRQRLPFFMIAAIFLATTVIGNGVTESWSRNVFGFIVLIASMLLVWRRLQEAWQER